MTDSEEVRQRANGGELFIGVDRAFARRFYTEVPLREIEAKTGEAPYFEKMIVYCAFLGGPFLLLVSFAESVWILRWWSVLFIPLAGAVWVVVHASSAKARAGMSLISLIVVVAAIGLGLTHGSARLEWGLALTYSASLWLSRLLYASATAFLRGFVVRNQRAWEWLREAVVVREIT